MTKDMFLMYKHIEEESYRIFNDYGYNPPDEATMEKARIFIEKLISLGINAEEISPSCEEGVFFLFRIKDYSIIIEFYNDTKISYIINNDKHLRVLEAEDCETIEEVFLRVKEFMGK